jgi:SAM-dependent methyltransferase
VTAAWTCDACGFAAAVRDGVTVLDPSIAAADRRDAAYERDALASAERRHFWFTGRARLIVWALRRYFPDASTFLDVGCGTGGVLEVMREAMPSLSLTGAEVDLDALAHARRRLADVPLLQVTTEQLPFDAEFDVVGAFDVLEHLDDDEGALRELRRAVRPGGGLVVTVPQHPALWSRVDEFSRHRRRYRRRELIDRIEHAGFSMRRVTSFVTFMLPFMAWSRARDRRRTRAFDPVAELRVGERANAMAARMFDVERYTIRAGMSWPAGGSLLGVAVRT